VEEGSFAQQLQPPEWVESVELREESDEPKLASAHLAPNLQLEVETRDQRGASTLLRLWSEILVRFATMPDEPPVRLPQSMREQIESLETTAPPLAHEHLAVAWKHAAESFAKHMAIETEDHQITYSELDRRIEHLASRLEISGIVAGSIVASELKDRCFFPIILLACARLDAIHLPLDPELPLERRRAMVSDANPALLLTDLPMEGGRHGLRTMGLDHESSSQATSAMPEDPRSPLTLLYTSGSTGKPKGVIMTHGGVCNEVHAIAREAGLAPGEKLLQFASPGFDAALEEVLSPLLSGATLTPRPESLKADFLAFQRYIDHHQVTVLDLSTAHWAAWCAWMKLESREIPESIKTTIIGGERATGSALDDWFHCGGRRHLLLNTYGPTEASIVATLERIDAQWQGNGDPTIGRPLPGVHIRIGDAHGAALPTGAAGEIWIGGDCIGPGYWQDPDRTAKAFHQIDGLSWYRTRDRACWDKEGRLRFLGRVDDQLKIRGNRIEPAEVSRELESFPGVSAAHVGPVKGPDGALALAAWVRWDGSTDKRWPAKLHEHCRTRLPAASIPTRWAEVSEFKLTERGKIDQQQLPKPELTSSSQGSSESPETETEALLAAIWQKILGLSFIGRNESFFELGGDSISALQMFAQVYRQFGRRMPVSTIIETPSLKGIAGILDDSKPIDGGRPRLHTISGTRQQSPLICFHGGDGGVVFYRPMARNLSIDRQIVAIESPLLSLEGAMPETPVTEMAQSYLDEILKHQTSGPYHLLGYSFGGLLAYEVARLLRARGETIAFIGMVDTLNPATPTPPYNLIQRAARCWSTSPDPSLAGRLLRLGTRASEGLATHFRIRGEERQIRQMPDSEPFSPLRALKVRAIHERVGLAFQPQALDATVHLFRASIPSDKFSIPDDYGWSGLASRLEIHEAPGSHLTMFDDENFGQLATLISKALSTPQE
ncbi:MAG: AMP-binding protein, partial [Haloferula sp.]